MKRINSDVVIALLLLVVSGLLFTETYFYRSMPGAIIGAKIWPRIVSIFMGGLSAIYLVQSLRAAPVEPAPDAQPWRLGTWLVDNRNVLAVFVLYGLFLASLPWLGMLLGGVLFVFVTLAVLGGCAPRSLAINAAVAIVTIGAMWALFTFGLGVILPQGEILPR